MRPVSVAVVAVLASVWLPFCLSMSIMDTEHASAATIGRQVLSQRMNETPSEANSTKSTAYDNSTQGMRRERPRLSKRVRETEPAHIEAVLSRYADMSPPPANLAQGVAHWDPPEAAMELIATVSANQPDDSTLVSSSNHRYGPALGLPALRQALIRKLEQENSLDLKGQEVMVTAGGNQAFAMIALALLDPGDRALLVRPFYCAHKCAVQLAGGVVVEAGWDPLTLLPDMDQLKREIQQGVKVVIITTPGNPTGAVCPREMMEEIAMLCRIHGAWLVVDEAYEHFLDDGTRHYSPCGNALGCGEQIIHLFSMSKSFGMAGWRVGYAVYPRWVSENMVKIQDTLPTHACTASQKIALAALEGQGAGCNWTRSKVSSLCRCREAMWTAVKDMGGVRGRGAFYFLVPVPVAEDEAVDILARQWGVLVTPGRAFGAPGHIRVSYGSLPEEACLIAIERLAEGLKHLSNAADADGSLAATK